MGALVLFITLLTTLSSVGLAQDTVDIGVLKDSEIRVVQDLLYPKDGTSELGIHVGAMPFDAFTFTPKAEFSYGQHLNESLGWEVAVGAGYSLKNRAYKVLESASYGITPDAYRYLSSVIADVQYAPIYAKMNVFNTILHHDVYFLGGGGLTIEQSFMPDKDMSFSPTFALGFGARVFLPSGSCIRVQLRDDIMIQSRAKTEETQGSFLKQNTLLSVGYTLLRR